MLKGNKLKIFLALTMQNLSKSDPIHAIADPAVHPLNRFLPLRGTITKSKILTSSK